MKLLITGSNGFVGGSVGRWAARAGHEVLGVARASQPVRGWLGAYAQADALTSDLAETVAAFAPDAVLHAAGTASVAASLRAPLDDLRASVLTWANVLDAVRRSGARPLVIFPSSAAVYGDSAELPAREEAEPRPISPYGFHKAACELLAREHAECFRVRVVVCRLFSVFGEAQRRLLVWELFQKFDGPGAEVWLEGTGEETRDYLHADDVAAALVELAAGLGDASDGSLRVVNVASGAETRVADLAREVGRLAAPSKEVRCRGLSRPGDPRRLHADITLLGALAPRWRPRPLAERLAQCVAAWRREHNARNDFATD